MTREEFIARFVDRMVARVGKTFADGKSVIDYAKETAVTYWDERGERTDETPEECADTDMSYWEDD